MNLNLISPFYNRQGCPPFSDLPIADSTLKNFYGIRYYTIEGGPISSLACNGSPVDRTAGYRWSSEGYWIPMDTLFVHAGCTMYEFEHYNYQGNMKTYRGPLSLFEGLDSFHGWGLYSYIVECDMQMPDCVPSDDWRTVAYLDNSGASSSTEFTYQHTIGTSWSSDISQAGAVSDFC